MTILGNKWVLLALGLALSIGLFLAVASYDNAGRYQSSARRGASEMERCTEVVRQGGPGTEQGCIDTYHAQSRAADASNTTTSLMVAGVSVAGLWVVFALIYFLRRRRTGDGLAERA